MGIKRLELALIDSILEKKSIRKPIDEATLLVTFDDGSEEEVEVPDRFAKDTISHLRRKLDLRQGEDSAYGYPVGADEAPSLQDEELATFTFDNPDPESQEKLNRLNIVNILGGPGQITTPVLRKIKRVLAEFSPEEIGKIQNDHPVVSTTDSPLKRELTGNWAKLILVDQAGPAVGKGEFAAALWYKDAIVNPGKGEDLTIGEEDYHVKYHPGTAGESGTQRDDTAWAAVIEEELAAALSSFSEVPTDSRAAKYINPETGAAEELNAGHFKGMLKAALTKEDYVDKGADILSAVRSNVAHFRVTAANNLLTYFGVPVEVRKKIQHAANRAYYRTLSVGGRSAKIIVATNTTLEVTDFTVPKDLGVMPESPGVYFSAIHSGKVKGATSNKNAIGFPEGNFLTPARETAMNKAFGPIPEDTVENKKFLALDLILESLLVEELTKSDKKEIEKLAKKQARKEIDKVVGSSLEKTIEKEVKKILKTKATRQELGDITKAVFKKLYRDLALRSPHIIDRIKV